MSLPTTILPAGTRVRVRTTNGGEVVAYLAHDYRPSFEIHLTERGPGFDGLTYRVVAWRIVSVEVVEG